MNQWIKTASLKEKEAMLERMLNALIDLLDAEDVPEKNCSCHISPPCEDCVQYSGIREATESAQEILAEVHREV